MQLKTWLVVGVILTAVAVVGSVIALTAQTAPPGPGTLPMALPIPAGTVLRISDWRNVNGTIVNGSIALFTVHAPGGRLVGKYYINSGYLYPFPSPGTPWEFGCPAGGSPPGTKSLNNPLAPGTYALWFQCMSQQYPTPANPWGINGPQTIEMAYG